MAQKAVASLRGMALPQQRRDSSSREPQTRRSHQFVDLTAASCRITGSTAFVSNLAGRAGSVGKRHDENPTVKLLRENLLAPRYYKESPIRVCTAAKGYTNLRA